MPVVDEGPFRSTAGSTGRGASPSRIDWSRAAWLGVALYASWALRDFLQDGLPLAWDAHSHLARAGFVERAFSAGRYPFWANDWYGGYRLLEFYSPLWYWITAGVSLVLRDIVLSAKLVVWAAQVSSVLLLFAFVKRITARTLPAVLAAVLLVHSNERGMVLGIVGNYPSTLLYLTIPGLLFLIWGCTEGRITPRRLFAGQALLVGVMLAGHFANAVLVLPAILAFEVTRIIQTASRPRDRLKAFAAAGGSLAAAVALVAFALVPALLHLDRVALALDRGLLTFSRLSIEPLLIVAGIVIGDFERPFLRDHGTFWMALGIAAGLSSLTRAQRKWLPFFVGLCTTLVTTMLVDERAAIGLAFFLYPLCAVAFDEVSRWAEAFGLRGSRFLIPAVGLTAAVVLPANIPPPDYVPVSSFNIYRAIPETPTRSRTLDITPGAISLDGFYGHSSFSPYLSHRAIPFGAYPQGASSATQVRLALASILSKELSDEPPAISDDALDVLYLDHVEFLVDRGEYPLTSRLGVGQRTAHGLRRLQQASPALFAPELAPLPERMIGAGKRLRSPRLLEVLEQTWEKDPLDWAPSRSLGPLFRTTEKQDWKVFLPLLRAMELDRTQALASRIFVDELLPGGQPSSSGPLQFAVLSHLEEPTRARIVARASHSGYVRISYARDPDLTVSLDGELVATVAEALGGAVTLAFPPGTHTIEVRAPAPTLQIRCLWLSFFLVLMLAAILVSDRRTTRLPDRRRDPRA